MKPPIGLVWKGMDFLYMNLKGVFLYIIVITLLHLKHELFKLLV